MTLEVLVATMHQSDFRKIKEMNIHSDVVFANQCDHESMKQIEFDGHVAKMISTNTRGVGLNRNIALEAATADILLFADDDVTYNDNYCDRVIQAFEQFPQADIIIFGIDLTEKGEVVRHVEPTTKRLHLRGMLKHGAVVTAIRRNTLLQYDIKFSLLFGGGCKYSHGEDSLFLLDCYRAGMKVYSYQYVLGTCSKDESTCFTGYHEKFFFDKGAWIACAFPKLKFLIAVYFVWRYRRLSAITSKDRFIAMKAGMRDYIVGSN